MSDREPPASEPDERPLGVRIVRKVLKILLWTLVVHVGLLVVAWLVLVIFFPDDKIKRMLTERLTRELGASVTAADLDLEILSGLVLVDVVIGAPEGFDAPLRVKRVVVDYSLWDIFKKKVVVERLVVEEPALTVEAGPGGTNLAALFGSQAPAPSGEGGPGESQQPDDDESGFVLDLTAVEVRDARLTVKTPVFTADLRGIDMDVGGSLGAPGRTRLEVRGELEAPEDPNVSLAITAEGALSPSRLSASAGLAWEAKLDAKGRVGASGKLRLDRVALEGVSGHHDLLVTFGASTDLQAETARLEELTVALDGSQILSVQGEVSGLDDDARMRFEVGLLRLPAALLAEVLYPLAPGATIEGHVLIEKAEIAGPLEGTPDVKARVLVEDVSISAPGVSLQGLGGKMAVALAPAPDGNTLAVDAGLSFTSADLDGIHVGATRLSLQGRTPLDESGDDWLLAAPRLDLAARTQGLHAREVQLTGLRLQGRLVPPTEPVRYGPGGFRVSRLGVALQGRASTVHAGDLRVRTAGIHLAATATGIAGRPGGELVAEKAEAILEVSAKRVSGPGLVLNRPDAKLTANSDAVGLPAGFERPVAIRGRLSCGALQVQRASAESAAATIRTRWRPPRLRSLPIKMDLSVAGLAVDRGHGAAPIQAPGTIRLALQGTAHLEAHSAHIADLSAGIPDVAEVQLQGDLDWRRQTGKFDVRLPPVQIERVRAALPAGLELPVPNLRGELELTGQARGGLPSRDGWWPFALDAKVLLRRIRLNMIEPPLQLSGLSGEIGFHAESDGTGPPGATLHADLAADRLGVITPSISTDGLKLVLDLTRDGSEVTMEGELAAGRLQATGFVPLPLANPGLAFKAQVAGGKQVRVERLRLRLPSMGTQVDLTGRFLRPPGAAGWERVQIASNLVAGLDASSAVLLPGGVSATGKASLDLSVETVSDAVLQARGRIAFDDLAVHGSGFALTSVRGAIPVAQTFQVAPVPGLLPGSQGQAASKDVTQRKPSRAYEEALLPMKGRQQSFAIGSVRLGALKLEALTGNLELAGGQLNLGNLRLGFLAGDVLADAHLTFAPPGTRSLSLDAEMTGIDLSGLGALSLGGSSEVSGNLRLMLDVAERAFSASINMTQIGRSTLQAVLVALDPSESNPGVLELRKFLNKHKVSPKRVSLGIRHGQLRLEVVFHPMGFAARTVAKLIKWFKGDTFLPDPIAIGWLITKVVGW